MLATVLLVLILLLARAAATIRAPRVEAAGCAAAMSRFRQLEIAVRWLGRPVSAVVAFRRESCTETIRTLVRGPP
jgi:uncharacterized membrane protein